MNVGIIGCGAISSQYIIGLKKNKKDTHTERSLILLVGKRKRLLKYLQKKDISRYRNIITELGLRK